MLRNLITSTEVSNALEPQTLKFLAIGALPSFEYQQKRPNAAKLFKSEELIADYDPDKPLKAGHSVRIEECVHRSDQ